MKVLYLNGYEYYTYPDGITSLEQFADYANKHYNEFVAMTELSTENCRAPYFIKEDVKTVYLNLSKVESISEIEIADILPKSEYEKRLKKIVAQKCVHCQRYTEITDGDNLKGHWHNISLDGECYMYDPIKEQSE